MKLKKNYDGKKKNFFYLSFMKSLDFSPVGSSTVILVMSF